MRLWGALVVLGFALGWALPSHADEEVTLLQVPNNGIQPDAVVGEDGTLHVIYATANKRGRQIYYVTRHLEDSAWSTPVSLNHGKGFDGRAESTRHAQIALGKNGRRHVVWLSSERPVAIWHTRSSADGDGFESPRSLVIRDYKGLSTGPAVAADGDGNVYVVWHSGKVTDEGKRTVFLSKSTDEGKHFSHESRVNPDPTGACACCSLDTYAQDDGAVYIAYRTAGDSIHRDMTWLESHDYGHSFSATPVAKWDFKGCPVTTTTIAQGIHGAALAWETAGQVFFAGADKLAHPSNAPGLAQKRRKNPALAANALGERLLAWGEGEGWLSGGRLYWQLFDSTGEPTKQGSSARDMPDRSVPVAVVLPDGRFVVIH